MCKQSMKQSHYRKVYRKKRVFILIPKLFSKSPNQFYSSSKSARLPPKINIFQGG
jgi:hypothetical protein